MGVFRVWQFIDSWGIINYQAGAGAADDADGVPVNVQPAGSPTPLLHPSACCSSLNGMHVDTVTTPRWAISCAAVGLVRGQVTLPLHVQYVCSQFLHLSLSVVRYEHEHISLQIDRADVRGGGVGGVLVLQAFHACASL